VSAASTSGSLTPMLSLAGPMGTAVGMGLDVAMDPEGMIGGITDTITALGEDLPENIGLILTELLPELVMAIIKAVPAIITGVFTELIPMLLDMLNPFNDGSAKRTKQQQRQNDLAQSLYNPYGTATVDPSLNPNNSESRSRNRNAGRSALSNAGDSVRLAGPTSVVINHHGITGTMRNSDVDAIVRGLARRNGPRGGGVA